MIALGFNLALAIQAQGPNRANCFKQRDFKQLLSLKVNKNENFFGFDFEFNTVSLLVMFKYDGFVTNNFRLAHYGER